MEQYENYFRIQSILYQYYLDGSYFSSGGGKIFAGAQDPPDIFFPGMDDRAGQTSSAPVRYSTCGVSWDPGQNLWMDP